MLDTLLHQLVTTRELPIGAQDCCTAMACLCVQVVEALRPHGLTLQNFASIREQAIGGFIQVGAHGTGARIPPVDEQVVAMKLVTPALGTLQLSEVCLIICLYLSFCSTKSLENTFDAFKIQLVSTSDDCNYLLVIIIVDVAPVLGTLQLSEVCLPCLPDPGCVDH